MSNQSLQKRNIGHTQVLDLTRRLSSQYVWQLSVRLTGAPNLNRTETNHKIQPDHSGAYSET